LAEEISTGLELRFEQGNEAGETALGLFNGIETTTVRTQEGKLDIGAMCETTKLKCATAI